jgi:homoserine dehydrogenase
MPKAPPRARRRLRPLRIALVGFGNVGRRFAELLRPAFARALREAGAEPRVTGIATANHGAAIDPKGLPIGRALRLVRAGRPLGALHVGAQIEDNRDFVRRVPADVLVEISTLDPRRGEPALSYVRAALGRGLHVVTANKGPVAVAGAELRSLAKRRRRLFMFEGAVMDGTPVFNMVERCLPGASILGFRGVLNATTTRILSRMEEGATMQEALAEAQAAGIAEADPSHDVDGWDAAVKACTLANALMNAGVTPEGVERRGIGQLSVEDVQAALSLAQRLRLVARARRQGDEVQVSVAPEGLLVDDVLASAGADGVLVLETDLMREIGIWQGAASVDQTAYALLSDLVAVAHARAHARA